METTKSASVMLASGDMAVTKANALAVAEELRARIADRRLDPLEVYERLQFNAEVAAQFGNDTTKALIREIIEERGAGTNKVVSDGGIFALRDTGTKYDYTTDRPWSDLNAVIAFLTDKRKQREQFLQTLPGTITEQYYPLVPDGTNGAIKRTAVVRIKTKPVSKSSTVGFAFTMSK